MSVKERIRMIRIMEKIEKNKAYSERIGIHTASLKGKGRKQDEVYRC